MKHDYYKVKVHITDALFSVNAKEIKTFKRIELNTSVLHLNDYLISDIKCE